MADVSKYVKFKRGTEELYNNLVTKDSDTLYFIFQDEQDTSGKLYLGNRLISNPDSNAGNVSLDDINNVLIDNSLADRDILIYNEATGRWENYNFNNLTMTGATEQNAGISGLVPRPVAGDQNKFLRGDGTWAVINSSSSGLTPEEQQSINNLQTTLSTLIGDHANQSIDQIVEGLIVAAGAPENLDSLQEIASWIQQHPSEATQMNSSIIDLQSRVASLETYDLSGFQSRISTLETDVASLQATQATYVNMGNRLDELTLLTSEINDCLRWHELSEE